jgi:hypothetical protein
MRRRVDVVQGSHGDIDIVKSWQAWRISEAGYWPVTIGRHLVHRFTADKMPY